MNYISKSEVSATVYLDSAVASYNYNITDGTSIFNTSSTIIDEGDADMSAVAGNSTIDVSGGFYTFVFNKDTNTLTVSRSENFTFYYAVPDSVVGEN